jgi:hypothetical protein
MFDATRTRNTLLVKTDMNGHTQWSTSFEYEDVNHLFQTADGGYILVGRMTYIDETITIEDDYGHFYQFWIVKTNALGQTEWNRIEKTTVPVGGSDYKVVQTTDGGFVLVGEKKSPYIYRNQHIWLMKMDENGIAEWGQDYQGIYATESIRDIIQTTDGGFLIAGNIYSSDQTDGQISFLIKTDSKGIIEWHQTYSLFYDVSSVIQAGNDYMLAGSSHKEQRYPYLRSMLLAKIDKNGAVKWSQDYESLQIIDDDWGVSVNNPPSVIPTTDGGFLLIGTEAGYTHVSGGRGGVYVRLTKTNSNGDIEWNKTIFDGLINELVRYKIQDAIKTADNGFALAGITFTFDPRTMWYFGQGAFKEYFDADSWLRKIDTTGTEVWKRTFDGASDEEWITDLIQTADSDYVFTGSINSPNLGKRDIWVAQSDENGLLQWNQTFGGTKADYSRVIIAVSDGFVIGGSTQSYGAGKSDGWLLKLDTNGFLLWNRTYGGIEGDSIEAVVQTADGGFALAGYTRSFGAGNSDAWLIKTDEFGAELWNQTFGGAKDDSALNIFQLADGRLVLTGYFDQYVEAGFAQYVGGGYSFWHEETYDQARILIINDQGVVQQEVTYPQSGRVRFYDLMQTPDDAIILTGVTSRLLMDMGGWMQSIGNNTLFYLELNQTGITNWNRSLAESLEEEISHFGDAVEFNELNLILTADEGFLLAGYVETWEYGRPNSYRIVTKMNSMGHIEWTLNTMVGIFGLDTILLQTADGGYALAGGIRSQATEGSISVEGWLAKLHANGTMLWEQGYGTTGGKIHQYGGPFTVLPNSSQASTAFPSWFFFVGVFTLIIRLRSSEKRKTH